MNKNLIKQIINMKKVAVIGSGTMGNGIAHVFAQFGYEVSLIDISQASLDKGMATIAKNLDRQVAKEAITEAAKEATIAMVMATVQSLGLVIAAKSGKTNKPLNSKKLVTTGICTI